MAKYIFISNEATCSNMSHCIAIHATDTNVINLKHVRYLSLIFCKSNQVENDTTYLSKHKVVWSEELSIDA